MTTRPVTAESLAAALHSLDGTQVAQDYSDEGFDYGPEAAENLAAAILAALPPDPRLAAHVWRTKTSIRDGSPTGRFVVDWTEAEDMLHAPDPRLAKLLAAARDSLSSGEPPAGWSERKRADERLRDALAAYEETP